MPPSVASLQASHAADAALCFVAASLREGLAEAASDVSPARTRGLLSLAAAVRRCGSVAAHAAALRTLLQTSSLEVDVLSLLLGRSLAPPQEALPPAQEPRGGPAAGGSGAGGCGSLGLPDDAEAAAACLLLSGCCLLDPATRAAAGALGAVELLLCKAEQSPPGSRLRAAALGASSSLLADCAANQAEWVKAKGGGRAAALAGGDAAAAVWLGELHKRVLKGDAAKDTEEAAKTGLGAAAVAKLIAEA